MIQFEGDRDFALPPAALWAKLSDARFLVTCIPDVEAVAKSEPAEAVCTIRPGFAFVRGTLELTIRVTEAVPDQSVKLLLRSMARSWLGLADQVPLAVFSCEQAGASIQGPGF